MRETEVDRGGTIDIYKQSQRKSHREKSRERMKDINKERSRLFALQDIKRRRI